jgi:LuxR family transcriptional regulator, maltose regulon positive regulatory protein
MKASTEPGAAGELRTAQDALARAQWKQARAAFEAILDQEESAEALEGLGMAAWWLDDAGTVFEARERAFQLYQKRGERRGAGRVAVALAQDSVYFRGEPAVATGWYRRAHRLLVPLDPVPEHGWLKLGEGDFAMSLEHDPALARTLAVEAAQIGRQLGDLDLEMMALALQGLALVCGGHLRDGMPLLDEATATAISGEMEDYYAIGYAYCCMVQACERVRDFERAAQWCKRAEEYGKPLGFGLLSAYCRAQLASVLIWRGDWGDAEKELDTAIRSLRAIRPPLQDEGTVRMARLRRLQGRRKEAEAFLGETEAHPLALVEQSALALEAGDATAAARLAERYLRQTKAADLTGRVPGLEVLLRARLALGERNGAQAALDALNQAADSLGTGAVRASVRMAQGLYLAAGGAHDEARAALEDAVDLHQRSGCPLGTGQARAALARVLLADGQRDAAEAEARAAHDAFESLGAADERQRSARLLAEIRDAPDAPATEPRLGNLTPRELEVLRYVAQGLSNARIAARLHVSEFTVKRHVSNLLTKLDLPTRAAAAAYAARNRML